MKKQSGFSLLEVMVTIAIIAILAAMALPSYMDKIVREQVEKSIPLAAETAQPPIAISWKTQQTLPPDNAAAGLPAADKIVNNYVQSVAVENGAIHITYGNRAHSTIKGKVLSLRPAVIEDSPVVPITWVCGMADAPNKMTVMGANKTNIDKQFLPALCRPQSKPN